MKGFLLRLTSFIVSFFMGLAGAGIWMKCNPPAKKLKISISSAQFSTNTERVDLPYKYMEFKGICNSLIPLKIPKDIPSDVPIYTNAERCASDAERPNWYEFHSSDAVGKIIFWYGKQMR